MLLWIVPMTYGQSGQIDQINAKVKTIDSDSELTNKEFDATEVYGHAFDGGGEIKVYVSNDQLHKFEEQIGLSFGRITTIIYLKDDEPILIIDCEENFRRNDDGSFDYSSLNKVFETKIYVADGDSIKTIKEGERIMSDSRNGVEKYFQKIEMAKGLLKK